jgi:oligopeptide transport system substrate-binding protein
MAQSNSSNSSSFCFNPLPFVPKFLSCFRSPIRFCFPFALVFAIAISSGCWTHESNVARGDREQILHRGIGPEIPDLDPQLAVGQSDYNVLIALFEGLVTEDPKDLHPVPGVAESWEISPDGLSYTFHLRANAKWSNGDAVTADDFVRSYQRMLTSSLGAENAVMLYVLQNAEPFHRNQLVNFSQVGVQALDTQTLRLRLEHPTPTFLSMLTHMAFMPVPVATIEKYGSATQRGNSWARPGRLVGNGPFQLSQWKIGQRMVVVKSLTYWDAAAVKLKEIDFYPIESQNDEERAFRAGQIHLTEAFPISKVDAYRRESPALLRIDPYLATEFFRLNVKRPFLDDVRVRRALGLAIDRKSITENILRGGQQPALSFTPPDTAGYTADPTVTFDPAAARAALAEAGYPEGKGAPAIELLFNPSESHRAVMEAVQEMWRRELGLHVQLVQQEFKTLLGARRAGNFQVLRSGFTADFIDPLSFLENFTAASQHNYTGWSDQSYDQLLFQAARTPDLTERNVLLKKAEDFLLKAAPIIPLYYYTHVFAIRPSVRNWYPTVLDHHPYKYVYLQP